MGLARFLHYKFKNKTKKAKVMANKEQEEASKVAAEAVKEAETEQEQTSEQTEGQTEEKAETNEVDEVEQLKVKLAEEKDSYVRLLAEFDNYKKRTLKEKSDLLKYGGENIIKALLPVIDDFDRAVANLPEEDSPIKEGILLIQKKFLSFLDQNNVKVIETKDAEFNTDFHEAATLFPAADESQKNKIIDCIQKGYTYNDKVIRYAKVVVAQ